MNIDTQLLGDCHVLGTLERASLLLNRNAAVGWLILVPDTGAVDWHELDDDEYARVTGQLHALSAFSAAYFAADKLNVAALGNVVRQMHIHVIARKYDDPCWPDPVWGQLGVERSYTAAEVDTLRRTLADDIGLTGRRQHMSDAALQELELRLAYQDQALNELSDVVYAQSREIERLGKRCRELEARVQALAEGGEQADDESPPPHY